MILAVLETIDVLLIAYTLQLLRQGNAALLGPLFGRYLTFQTVLPYFLSFSVGSLIAAEILRLSKLKLTAFAFALIFVNPFYVDFIKEHAFELGSRQGPIASSTIVFLTTIALQISSCLSLSTGKRSYFKSILSLLVLIGFEKTGIDTYGLLCCDINRACLVLTELSVFLSQKLKRSPSKYAILCLLILMTLSTISTNIYQMARVRQCMPASSTPFSLNENLTIYARAESNTGFVSVVECPSDYGKVLVMKCDHSILGGQYLDYDRDSIFGIFYFMDFVRFVKRGEISTTKHKRALIIGLGIGVSAKSLIDSGIDVDVVEIDPTLYQYALDYFEMPKPKNAYLQDARKFMEERSESVYDYILHDVFSGGVVSPSLFSVEALSLAKRMLLSDGVFVVNFVGKLGSPAFQSVIATLQTVFKNTVQIPEDPNDEDVQNCLFFSTDHGNKVEFDFFQDTSYSSGGTYRSALNEFKEQKKIVPPKMDPALAILDNRNPLESEQYSSALLHFEIVGNVFKHKHFWTESY